MDGKNKDAEAKVMPDSEESLSGVSDLASIYGAISDFNEVDETDYSVDPHVLELEQFFDNNGISRDARKSNRTFVRNLLLLMRDKVLTINHSDNIVTLNLKVPIVFKNAPAIEKLAFDFDKVATGDLIASSGKNNNALDVERRILTYAAAFSKQNPAYFITQTNAKGGRGVSIMDYNRIRALMIFFLN